MDVYIKESDKVFDIELQNSFDDDLALRTRFYKSMIDTDNLLKGQDYSELPTSFIIFICKYDPFNFNLPTYTFKNRCEENPSLLLNDKTIKKIFNAIAYKKQPWMAVPSMAMFCNSKTRH